MNNAQILQRFFAAENQRDWATYQTFLHPAVEWQLHKGETHVFSGIDAYMAAIQKAYEHSDIRFSCREMVVSADGQRIVAHLLNDGGMRSVDIFDFRDGKIYREFEFIMD